MENISEIKDTLKKYNQTKLINMMNKFSNEENKKIEEQLKIIDLDKMKTLYEKVQNSPDVESKKITHITYVDKSKLTEEEKNIYKEIGDKIIKNNEYAVVTMAGGQGTRLGHKGPKGTFKINVNNEEKYLFQIIVENLQNAQEEYGIFIEISALKRYRWVYTIYKLFEEKIIEVWNDGTYVSYEDAVEAALKYWLEKQGEQKETNLVEILKHYPKETELYSPLYGKLWLAEVDEKNEIITCYKHHLEEGCTRAVLEQEDTVSFYSNGTTGLPDFNVSKDCMLFLYDIVKQGETKL